MRVSLITTGKMEFCGLDTALQRLFPTHAFRVEPDTPGQPFHGFTSCRVPPLLTEPAGHAVRMMRAALGTILAPDATTPPADLAYIIEDVELFNKTNEAAIIDHVRAAANKVLQDLGPGGNRTRVMKALREQVSFHLAMPMPESWFFGDFCALQTEVPTAHWPPHITANRDPEDFLTDDPAYENDTGSACAATTQSPNRPRPFWLTPRRKEHPKAYMKWLMRDPTVATCSRYKESQEGVRLLNRLDWSTVLSTPTWFPYLRALVRDLESALGPPTFAIAPGGNEARWTSISHAPANTVLRNL